MRHLRYALLGIVVMAALMINGEPVSAGATVDLAINSPSVTIYGPDTSEALGFGRKLATGDFNGDGVDDLLVGHPDGLGPGNSRRPCAGEAYVFFGSPSLPETLDVAAGDYDVVIYGTEDCDQLGYSVAAGDLNRDGTDDIVLGAPGARGPGNTRWGAGEVYAVFGSPGLTGTIDVAAGQQSITIYGWDGGDGFTNSGDTLGYAVAVHRPSRDYFLLGAPGGDGPWWEGNTRIDAGEVYAFPRGLGGYGSGDEDGTPGGCGDGIDNGGDGAADVADTDCYKDLAVGAVPFTMYGGESEDRFGSSVASGNFESSGTQHDIAVGAPFADGNAGEGQQGGEVYIFDGAWVSQFSERDVFLGQYSWARFNPDAFEWLGWSLAAERIITRVSGTNHDLVVGLRQSGGPGNTRFTSGEVWIWFIPLSLSCSWPNWIIYGDNAQKLIEPSLAVMPRGTAGDVVVGSGGWGNGANYLIQPSINDSCVFSGGRITDLQYEEEDLKIVGADSYDGLGDAAASGDLNGDGNADLVLSARYADGPDNSRPDTGEVYIIFGPDSDSDKVLDGIDNCPSFPNPDQDNTDVTVNPPGDSDGDECDLDDDDDGIYDEIDGRWFGFPVDESKIDSFSFTDEDPDLGFGGTTYGEILFRSGLYFAVTDVPNPLGVRIRTSGSALLVRFCGLSGDWEFLFPYDATIKECGSAEVEVTSGPIMGRFGTIDITLPTGTTATVDEPAPDILDVSNSPDSTDSVTVGGLTLIPGESATGLTDEDGDGLVSDVDPCPANPDCDGDSQGVGDAFGLFLRDGVEVFMGTLVTVACAATSSIDDEDPDALGPDWDDSQDVDGSDLFLFAERFGTKLGVPPPVGKKPYWTRFDIYPTDASLHKIDGSDLFVLASYFGDSCP